MRIVFFGSGVFGQPTLEQLIKTHEVALVITQPDRPAGRRRSLTPTPIAIEAEKHGLRTIKPDQPNAVPTIRSIQDSAAEAYVVIAYGHKLGPELLGETFAINLHASLLPKYRGAAPINWAMIHGKKQTGISVITLAQRMDAGAILAQESLDISPFETAGELHDRLSLLGPTCVTNVLDDFKMNCLRPIHQNETEVSLAVKLNKSDGTVDFNQPATAVRNRIHGLTPWPGCTVISQNGSLKLGRAVVVNETESYGEPGELLADHSIACAPGALTLLEVQPPGRRMMCFNEYLRGHPMTVGQQLRSS